MPKGPALVSMERKTRLIEMDPRPPLRTISVALTTCSPDDRSIGSPASGAPPPLPGLPGPPPGAPGSAPPEQPEPPHGPPLGPGLAGGGAAAVGPCQSKWTNP